MNITLNSEKQGIEIRFDTKPEQDVLAVLKDNGFRWSKPQKMWWAKNTEDRMAVINSLKNNHIEVSGGITKKISTYDLWAMTRTDGIESRKCYNNKEIAADIRKHLRERFPMIKWSVTSNRYDVNVYIMATPYAEESEELKAIVAYACAYTNSWNYDNSDSMTDYYDVNFYSNITHAVRYNGEVWTNNAMDYNCVIREMNAEEARISEAFQKNLKAWKEAENIRRERELQEEMVRREEERAEAERLRKIREENEAIIEAEADVRDADYFILECETYSSKLDSIDEYQEYMDENREEVENRRQDCRVTREVHFSEETYNKFANMLLSDFSFLQGMGGSSTMDNRVNDMGDYSRMSKEERETVEWYSDNCVAIYVDNKLKLVIDPQGYSYARYTYFPTEDSIKETEYKGTTDISEEEANNNKAVADELYEASAEIIIAHDWTDMKWRQENYDDWKEAMKWYIYNKGIDLKADYIRAMEPGEFKEAMYTVLHEYNSIQEQFKRCDLMPEQRFTIIKLDEWIGGVHTTHGTFKSIEYRSYAQFEDAVKIVYRPEKKRNDYYVWIKGDCLIFDGWVSFPRTVLYDVEDRGDCICSMSKYMAFDHKQLDDVLEYFSQNGITPIVNTTKRS